MLGCYPGGLDPNQINLPPPTMARNARTGARGPLVEPPKWCPYRLTGL